MGNSQTTGELETHQRKSILIIDDEPGILESLDQLFSDKFNVLMAVDGEEGIGLLKRRRFNLVLLDLTMPGMDGMEVLKWIRNLSEPPPVMILTGHSTHERAKGCADSGVLGYIEKPFNTTELFDRVTAILKEGKKKGNIATNSEPAFAKKISSLVEKVIRFINIRYTDHANPLRPKEVAAHLGVSREHLVRRFKEETGCGVNEYINRLRIKKAKQLFLQNKDAIISKVAYDSGFENETYFLKIFKRYTGTTPTNFRKPNI